MWLLKEHETFIFKHPFRCYIAGPSFSGKTTLIQKILINQQKMINKPIERIVFCYKTMQPGYEVFKYLPIQVEFVEGLVSLGFILGYQSRDSALNNLYRDALLYLNK